MQIPVLAVRSVNDQGRLEYHVGQSDTRWIVYAPSDVSIRTEIFDRKSYLKHQQSWHFASIDKKETKRAKHNQTVSCDWYCVCFLLASLCQLRLQSAQTQYSISTELTVSRWGSDVEKNRLMSLDFVACHSSKWATVQYSVRHVGVKRTAIL